MMIEAQPRREIRFSTESLRLSAMRCRIAADNQPPLGRMLRRLINQYVLALSGAK